MKICQTLFLCAAIAIVAAIPTMAQQPAQQAPSRPATPPAAAMFGMMGPKPPEIGADGAVTFRLRAPQASLVGVSGNWQPGFMSPPLPMTKGDDGVWQLTVSNLKPEVWTYNFVVDGVRILDPGNVNVMRDGTRFINFLTIPGTGSELFAVNDVPHGTVQQIWYPSPSLGVGHRRMYVYTPAGYEGGTQRYPVFYLLHGGGGDEDAWDNLGRANEIFDNLIAAGKAKPMIVIMTNGNFNQTAAPGVTKQAEFQLSGLPSADSAEFRKLMSDLLKFSDSLVTDVIPFVDQTYRTIPDRDHRALAGLSMGGAQTLDAGLHHLDQFSYLASFSGGIIMFPGAVKIVPTPPGTLMLPGVGQELNASGVAADFPGLDASVNSKLHLLYITCGENDGLLKINQQFMDWLTSLGIHYDTLLLPGYMHEWPFWRISLANLAPKLFN
jgi:enterochelin esterase-like enzyme